MTSLVNLHHEKCEIKIDRTTLFGNPFDYRKLGITREECVRKYREWFYNKLKDDSFRNKVLSLKDRVLGCWCVPNLCHGHILLEYLENIPIKWSKKEKTLEDYESNSCNVR